MKRSLENSRRARALAHLDTARDAIEKSISLLGGRVRRRSVKRNFRLFTVRQYLESIDSRITVCIDLLRLDPPVKIGSEAGPMLISDFEIEYDKSRDIDP